MFLHDWFSEHIFIFVQSSGHILIVFFNTRYLLKQVEICLNLDSKMD